MKEDCIFCKLANGIFPTNCLFENEAFKVIFDASPATKGHVLIIPKEHCANIFEVSEDICKEAFVLAKKVAGVLKEVTKCDGVNIVQNNGEAAGQTVFHLHIHVIPRYNDDNVGLGWKQGGPEQEEIDEIITKAKNML